MIPTISLWEVEQAKLELARLHTADFASSIEIPTAPVEDEEVTQTMRLAKMAEHHKLLCDRLDDVEEGRIPNLMVFMPPGSAKSTYVDVVFVPRFMARRPRRHVILASYASNIAAKQGRRARQLIKQPKFQEIWGCTLDPDKSAADEWMLTNGSEYMAGGILSGLTGNRAALAILDDPIRGREAAESETIREKTWEAYRDDLCSRLIPGAPQIMILTRWHADDPAGRILPEGWSGESGWFNGRDGRRWYVLCLPAIADRADDPLGRQIGETLWPEWFSLDHWKPFQTNQRTWSSLYQQKPSPDTGAYFKREWIIPVDEQHIPPRESMMIYGGSDYAVTANGGDYTVHCVIGVGSDNRIYLLDLWRGQVSSDVWVDSFCNLVRRYKPVGWAEESGQIKSGVGPFLVKRMIETESFVAREQFATRGDKAVRAQSIRGRMALQGLHVPRNAPWLSDFIGELMSFPVGVHDDQVDALGLVGQLMDRMATGTAVKPQEERPVPRGMVRLPGLPQSRRAA